MEAIEWLGRSVRCGRQHLHLSNRVTAESIDGDLEGTQFLGLQLAVHVSKPHLHGTHAMNALEVAVKIADLGVAAIGCDGLNGRRNILEQLSSSRHSYSE
jgi:hypothetical protein